MSTYKIIGTEGEQEVVSLIRCPNCNNKLMLLPPSYPMFDVQCTACNFRAQVKNTNANPNRVGMIRGAGWDIMDKVLKAGYLVPSLIVNFKWENKHEIRFYPFIRKSNLVKRVANIKSHNRIYNMFDYNIKNLQYDVLYKNEKI